MQKNDPSDLEPPANLDANGPLLDVHALVRLVMERLWLIVACMVVTTVGAVYYIKKTPKVYDATATVQVEQEDAKVVKVEQLVSEDLRSQEILNTVIQKITTAALLEKALEANQLLPVLTTTNPVADPARIRAIEQFAYSVRVALRRNTRLVDITVRNPNPQLASDLANSLVEMYLAHDALLQQSNHSGATAYLRQEADRLKKKLEASDQSLQDYRKQVGTVSLAQNQDIITPQLQDLNKRLTESQAVLTQAKGAHEDALNMSTNVPALLAYPQIATDPEVALIAGEVARLENQLAVIRKRYRAKHPKYLLAESSLAGLQAQLATTVLKVRARIQDSLQIAYQNALTTEAGLKPQLLAAEAKALKLSDTAVRFNVLNREVQSDQALFDSIITRLGEMAVTERLTPERIRMIQAATPPLIPAAPRPKIILIMGLMSGAVVGVAISFLLYLLNSSFRTVDEAEKFCRLPVLGAIPKLTKAELGKGKLPVTQASDSEAAELFRTLRSALSLLGSESGRRTFLFTSALPGEGKTFTAVNYACSLAQCGHRTLLLDLDLRQPMVEEFLLGRNTSAPGLSDYFLQRRKLDEVCQPHKELPLLSWINAGATIPNPAELLAQGNFEQLLTEALGRFDRVVIDSAPVLPVSDTLLFAKHAQTVVLVAQGGKTPRKIIARSLHLLKNAHAPMGGIVLNLMPKPPIGSRYYSYHYGHSYGAYGKRSLQKSAAPA